MLSFYLRCSHAPSPLPPTPSIQSPRGSSAGAPGGRQGVRGTREVHLPTLRATMSFHHAHRQAYNQSEGWQFLLQENWIASEERSTDIGMWASPGALVSQAAIHHKVPQTGQLQQQKLMFSQLWSLEVWDQSVRGVGAFWDLSPWHADSHHLLVSS